MAENTPFSYSQTFTDLLNQTNTPQTPLFTTPQSPLFSTQNVDVQTVEKKLPEASREARRRWTVSEDGVLVSAWLNTSKDAIVGCDQKAGAFWKRVALYYAASPGVTDLPNRESNTCKQRWVKINESVQRFCGCYDKAQRQKSSGQSEDDILEMAYKFYSQDQGTNFTLEHAWRMLRHDQKWCTLISQKGKSHSKRAQSPTSNACDEMEDQTMERPVGVKAAKVKGKKSVKATNEERDAFIKALNSMWVMREKDNSCKERLSKQKLLDSLIVRTETLSEMEIILKNKLISEML